VVLAPDLTLADPDDADLLGATVAITSGYQQGVDVLVLTSRPVGISASWDESTGTMTLTGTTTVETWQNALRTVAFDGLNTGANGVRRVVTFTVQDRVQSSAPASRGVTMVAR
jgi:hypothetical protein